MLVLTQVIIDEDQALSIDPTLIGLPVYCRRLRPNLLSMRAGVRRPPPGASLMRPSASLIAPGGRSCSPGPPELAQLAALSGVEDQALACKHCLTSDRLTALRQANHAASVMARHLAKRACNANPRRIWDPQPLLPGGMTPG